MAASTPISSQPYYTYFPKLFREISMKYMEMRQSNMEKNSFESSVGNQEIGIPFPFGTKELSNSRG